jgi:hypothetical protein
VAGAELTLVAPSVADKERWAKCVQQDYDAFGPDKLRDNCPAALIAPIRRRHMSMQRTKSGNAMEQFAKQTSAQYARSLARGGLTPLNPYAGRQPQRWGSAGRSRFARWARYACTSWKVRAVMPACRRHGLTGPRDRGPTSRGPGAASGQKGAQPVLRRCD